MSWTADLDPHFDRLWTEFESGLAARQVLDTRSRLLVLIGECVVLGETDDVVSFTQQALDAGVPATDIHELMLQACTYAGRPVVRRSLNAFADVLIDRGRIDELRQAAIPASGPTAPRSRELEQPSWRILPENRERVEALMQKYGWQGIGTGLRTQPTHHVQGVSFMDSLDEDYTRLWLNLIYAGMYSRGVLDDKTRTLCMIGECLALQSHAQTENHMRNALVLGARPQEVLEVVWQSSQLVGMPRSLWGREILQRILAENGKSSTSGGEHVARVR
ncbi:MAG TPA: carboxymuconolactone decarboxylase family protein [Chloroflexota bacterium]